MVDLNNVSYKKLVSLLLALAVVIMTVAGCGEKNTADKDASQHGSGTSSYAEIVVNDESPVGIRLAQLGDNVSLHTPIQAEYLRDKYDMISAYAFGTSELSHSGKVELTWDAKAKEGVTIDSYIVRFGTKNDLSDAVEATVTEPKYDVRNLLLGQKYYWSVTAVCGGEKYESDIASFTTETKGPRCLYVDGITNVRDTGGWQTESGGTVKQELLYRCGRLNKSGSTEIEITDKGIKTMLEDMGVKTEIDLRGGASDKNESGNIKESPLGDSVKYYHIPMNYEGNILSINSKPIRQCFEILADEKNYPVIYHCSIGTDRTGMLAFLLNGLLGVSEEDLYRDYLYSNFGNIGGSRDTSAIASYISIVRGDRTDKLSDCIYDYLLSIGVKKEQIESVKRILGPQS